MEYEKLEYFISAKRLERYLVACNHSKVYTSRLYSLNMSWMDPVLTNYISEFDDIDYHINSGEKLRKRI